MDPSFWLKLGLSFTIGSLWVTFTTISSERFGSKVGGLIGGFPSTVVIALLFIGLTQSPLVAAQATTVMPLAQGLNGLFVLAFMLLSPFGLWAGVLGALSLWLFQSTLLYVLQIQAFWISILGWLVLLVLCYLALEKWMKVPSHGKIQIAYQPSQIAGRALFGGTVIAFAVLMSKLGGPLLGGIFGSFPAMFLTTLVITYVSGGISRSRSVGKSILVSGSTNVPLYEIAVRFLYPAIGLALGTTLAVLLVTFTSFLTYQFMKVRMG